MERESGFQRFARKVLALLLVTGALLAISVLTTAMVSTATFTATEAGGIIDHIPAGNRANALWAFIIPAAFFLVLSSRNWKARKQDPDR